MQDRGDADQSDSDDSVHDQQKRRMSGDAVRSSRQHLQHGQEHPASLAIAVDEGDRAQRHYDGDHNARGGGGQKRKFKQKRSTNTRRTDHDSATPTDVGLQSAHTGMKVSHAASPRVANSTNCDLAAVHALPPYHQLHSLLYPPLPTNVPWYYSPGIGTYPVCTATPAYNALVPTPGYYPLPLVHPLGQ
jgi:hypothetical protein